MTLLHHDVTQVVLAGAGKHEVGLELRVAAGHQELVALVAIDVVPPEAAHQDARERHDDVVAHAVTVHVVEELEVVDVEEEEEKLVAHQAGGVPLEPQDVLGVSHHVVGRGPLDLAQVVHALEAVGKGQGRDDKAGHVELDAVRGRSGRA